MGVYARQNCVAIAANGSTLPGNHKDAAVDDALAASVIPAVGAPGGQRNRRVRWAPR
jgi:hypothetical protein